MKNFLIMIFLLGLSISQDDIITGTNSCSPCTDSNAACTSGTGCVCNNGYRLNQDNSGCIADTSTIITGTESCTSNSDCGENSHATCTTGTGCQCESEYRINDDNSACISDTGNTIITGTGSCTVPCPDSHATCTIGTGCKCNEGYQLKQDKSGCEQTLTPASDIITGTDSCTTAAGCQDSHATCTVGTGCKCNDGYELKQDKSGCEAKSGSGSGTTNGNNESDSDDSSSFLKYSLLAVLSLLF